MHKVFDMEIWMISPPNVRMGTVCWLGWCHWTVSCHNHLGLVFSWGFTHSQLSWMGGNTELDLLASISSLLYMLAVDGYSRRWTADFLSSMPQIFNSRPDWIAGASSLPPPPPPLLKAVSISWCFGKAWVVGISFFLSTSPSLTKHLDGTLENDRTSPPLLRS